MTDVIADKPFIALLGDSNTWLSGDSCNNPKGWGYYLHKLLPDTEVRSYARSGATWSHTPKTANDILEYSEVITDNNVMLNQLLRLSADVNVGLRPTPDVIVFAAGTNDAWFEPKYRRGCLALSDSLSSLTVEGAVRTCLNMAHSLYNGVTLIVLTPMESAAVPDSLIDVVTKRIEDGCAGLKKTYVLRMDTLSPVRSGIEKEHRHYTYDGTHTSEAGAEANALIVAEYLKNSKILHQK